MKRSLYDRLREARKNLGLSQDYVANQMGLHRTTIVAIEKNNRKVSADELEKFSVLYGLSIEYLMRGIDNDSEVQMFARAYSELSEIDKREIMNLIEFKKQLKGELDK